ncbi:tetratricopeptide repeat domain 27 [Mycena rosella]|uniref:Tetratricopeptide repeat domain 27 n=1 Tax=Mycena rosella TaxID=1033263 RepID=A0AAD7GJS4_MYCRO|nr:tetratricopeptide repeat domain 27 [Mycena rosella]
MSPPQIALIEKALLTGKWDALLESSQVVDLAKSVVEGDFGLALQGPFAKKIFQNSSTDNGERTQLVDCGVQITGESADDDAIRLILAVACLHAFIQVNWTGPDLDFTVVDLLQVTSSDITEESLNQRAVSELAYGGEPAYHLTQYAVLLRLAQLLLEGSYQHCPSVPWWKLRVALVHQQILDEPAPLPPSIISAVEPLTVVYASDPELSGHLELEQGLLQHQVAQDKLAAEYFVKAARATGMEYELTGALGKRTKFQQNELSQLVLLAESQLKIEESPTDATSVETPSTGGQVPETLALNDDTLLEQTAFTSSSPTAHARLSHLDPSGQPALHPLDQSILLAMCLNVKNTSPVHGLTAEQMTPYVARVISHPRNWSVHTMALLLRARLESTRTRTVERATLQLQALIEQMPTADAPVAERLRYAHALPLPSKWEMERELATRFLSLGAVRSALDIFERLEMWEEAVKCWQAMERREMGVAIVRDLLEGRKAEADVVVARGKAGTTDARRVSMDVAREAKLWCILGDLEPENAVAHYERAWDVSRQTAGRAMRSLGGYHFARAEFPAAIECLKKAVAINPLLSRSWFILGCACMRVEDWPQARVAFGRCVAIDEEDGESWSNLASMYMRMGTPKMIDDGTDAPAGSSVAFENKLLAFRALKQGLRSAYENWRMWYNYMIISIEVGELAEACRALGRVIESRGAEAVDEDVIERLVNAVTHGVTAEQAEAGADPEGDASNPNEGRGLLRPVKHLLDDIVLPRESSSPRVFRAYARLLTWECRWDDALKASMDAYRCSAAGTMERGETDVSKWRDAVSDVEDIVGALRNFGPRAAQDEGANKWRLQARSIVRTFMGKTKDGFEDEPEWSKLEEMLDELKKRADD